MEQTRLPFLLDPLVVHPHPDRLEPALWISRVLLLREPRIHKDAIIRDIRLHRGLNILWARPSPPHPEPNRAPGKVTGHSAGKTTFCRMIRYLLGEKRFGTPWLQDRIRSRLPDGWIVGEVFVRGEPWVLSRPFALCEHRFASRDRSIEEALAIRGPYQDFLSALEEAVTKPLPVRTLPHSGASIDWPHLLPWLTRDQEARFAGIVDWRDSASESDSWNPSVGDRHVIVRTVLDLMSNEEATLEQRIKEKSEQRKRLEDQAPNLEVRAEENYRQLAACLDLPPQESSDEPLFVRRVEIEDEVKARREALARKEADLPTRRIEVEQVRRAWEEAQDAVGAHREALGKLKQKYEDKREYLRQHEAGEAGRGQAALLESVPAPPGRCNAKREEAIARGCPMFVEAPVLLDARRGQREVMMDIESERKALAALEQQVQAAGHAVAEADEKALACRKLYLQLNTALADEEGQVKHTRGMLEEIEKQLAWAMEARGRVERHKDEQTSLKQEREQLQAQTTTRRQARAKSYVQLSDRFEAVVRELLGAPFGGQIDFVDGKLIPRLMETRELRGAAMDTLGVLAFDLTALTLGIEGRGFSPGFWIHDGPREADLDASIYAQLFSYAERLEQAFKGSPGFQYIVTTTTPPPKHLQKSTWLLRPELNASTSEGKLLKMDL